MKLKKITLNNIRSYKHQEVEFPEGSILLSGDIGTGKTSIHISNVTDGVDMLSTALTIDSGETGSDTAATPAVVDVTKDDVVENDLIRIDVDERTQNPPEGLLITLGFKLP